MKLKLLGYYSLASCIFALVATLWSEELDWATQLVALVLFLPVIVFIYLAVRNNKT